MPKLPSPRSRHALWRVVVVLLAVTVTAVAASPNGGGTAAAAATAGTSRPAATPGAAAPASPPTNPAPAPVGQAGQQRRTVLYKPGAAPPGAPTALQAPSRRAARAAGAVTPVPDGSMCSKGDAAQVCVTYTGFNAAFGSQGAQAMQAYQAAANIWAQYLNTPVTITIAADVASQGSDILASTGPDDFFQLSTGGPWYPVALMNALTGTQNDPGYPDIDSSVGSPSETQWYLGTDGQTPPGAYDLESVALHEIAHGLGFLSLTDANDPGWGCPNGVGCIGNQMKNLPSIFDTFLVAQLSATNTNVGWLTAGPGRAAGAWGNDNSQLYGALTGWNPYDPNQSNQPSRVYWTGPQGTTAAGGSWPKIYSPNPWSAGSSISHLDYGTYPWGSPNGLLNPFVGSGIADHSPGPILLGMLRDIGWTETVSPRITSASAVGPSPSADTGNAQLTWTPATRGLDGTSPVTGYQVQAGRIDGQGSITTVQLDASATSYTFTGLAAGVPYWMSVTPLGAAAGPGSAAGVLPQDLAFYTSVTDLVTRLMPNFWGGPNSGLSANLVAQMSYPGTLSTAQGLSALNTYVLDPVLGPLTRLYLAFLGRLPDQGGTSYWLGQLRSGVPLPAVSNYFAGSPEFVNTYGSLDNPHFVVRVYQNVLGRPPDVGGFLYWTNQLNQGLSRGQLMLFFSESAENLARQADTVLRFEAYWGMFQRAATMGQLPGGPNVTSVELFKFLLDDPSA